MIRSAIFLCIFLLACGMAPPLAAQQVASVNWLSFEELEEALETQPKKVFIDFYTDWCSYCRKMDKSVFTDPEVVERLNQDYYAVKFDAESEATIHFSGQDLVNDQVGKSRRPLHQMAQLLALREGSFVAPTLVVLDADFRVTDRHFQYLSSKKLLRVLGGE